ncbi:hypothetical protein KAFR_0L02040 [Kazachstania africana CBS 2517]|uniref:NADH-cytochrome b5 reductase n=1 Tax=Kazachstania africana (strain ATCC 22294 / BCRC 22015 / CBS 2517 / CECT 1963 / NBRC 1671 / NRRL Y-8276) TaxID=1071382 RepID=H2B2G5_KAZAF|nr:hypothetical protein KAFR_0L02040 [Kazachstania africana CBS 2517]CCF60815.1 hypothetical protein KAFR_0L02040 [Kazachstania africana CBS 2517]
MTDGSIKKYTMLESMDRKTVIIFSVASTIPTVIMVKDRWLAFISMLLILILPSYMYDLYLRHEPRSINTDTWCPLPLISKTEVNGNSAIYRFKLNDSSELLQIPIGYHLAIRVNIGGKVRVRYYTPIDPKNQRGHFDLLVKSYSTGVVSKYFGTLKPGDKVEFKGPLGEFSYKKKITQLGIIAGGSGITPVLQILNEIVIEPEKLKRISLIYANETENDILMKKDLDKMATKYPHFEVHYVVHFPSKTWKGDSGYITKDELKKYLPKYSENHRLLVCGPLEMNEMVLRYAKELGWNNGFQTSKSDDKVFVF